VFIRQPCHGSGGCPPGLSPRRHGFDPGLFHVVFVVNKTTMGQVYLRVLLFLNVSIIHSNKSHIKVKVNQSHYRPGQALRVAGDWGCRISCQSAFEGGKVVGPTHRPPLPPQEIFLVLVSLRDWDKPRAIVWPDGLCQWKISNDIIGNRTRDLPIYGAVPQLTSLPRAWSEV